VPSLCLTSVVAVAVAIDNVVIGRVKVKTAKSWDFDLLEALWAVLQEYWCGI
jgi:hypothetical protein